MKGLITLLFYTNVSLYRGTTAVLFVVLSLPINTIAVFYLLRLFRTALFFELYVDELCALVCMFLQI